MAWWVLDRRTGRYVRTKTKPAAGGIRSRPARPRPRKRAPTSTNGTAPTTPAQPTRRPPWLLVDDPSASVHATAVDVEVSLIDWRSAPVTATLTASARDQIIYHAGRRGGWTEEGGPLVGLLDRPGEILVTDAAGPGEGSERTPTSYRPDGIADELFVRALEAQLGGRVLEVGSWHLHPIAGRTKPSPADIQSAAYNFGRCHARDGRWRSGWLELVVSPAADGCLTRPVLSGWYVRPDGSRYIAEPCALS